ncbi:MAG: metal-dependent transcriptional regulator [Gemmatimonadetes bacterium]|nr:metal-dependent transcriptional regulator [Gemmatimonadota bacterium]
MTTDPIIALSAFAILALLAAAALWPRHGIWARLVSRLRLTEKVCTEDTLKHIHSCNRRCVPCTVQSLAGQIGVSTTRAAALLATVIEQGLAREGETGPTLTESGEAWALRLVRTHRLWESYLAERTGVAPTEWHEEAERVEHRLSGRDTETLAASLGHPRWDPHGDPIPTSDGELPRAENLTLLNAPLATRLSVVHLEDEPAATYAELLRLGLFLGQELTILSRDGSSLRIDAGFAELHLAATHARNVGVRRVSAETSIQGVPDEASGWTTLAAMAPGESGRVVAISPACGGPQRRRLLDLGVVAGTEIQVELQASGGGPVAYRICDALIALRREQAAFIAVVPQQARAGKRVRAADRPRRDGREAV